ncbi:hypothetical protein K457DRAFT_154194 [Linnemannia elongata AG-77]|uniref:Uncharacterized protein n=1 Tax=Linnemannia elongata AG-77 TaxID=1314771 RepID=A0A197K1N0_9FUNG|nr:hypothetical protein K457DRAFT_154194 [Linnemannia elongata AG-77]
MSTMHCANNASSPWSSPKSQLQNPLKRRHTRGNPSHSPTSTSIRSLSLSPTVSSVSLSDSPNNNNNIKTSPGFKSNKQHQQQQAPHSTRRNTDFQHHDFSHHDLNSSYHDFHPQQQQHQRDDNEDRVHGSSVMASSSGIGAKGNFVPSWFGSLRSFAISATTSSRGAFSPLNTTSSSSSTSSSTSSSPKSSKKSRGRSSSIYYSSTRVFDDDDDEDENDSGSSSEEPVTDLNGLKENRVRGPRVNWMALDPSLGSFFAGSYKPLPTSESENDLRSSSNEGGWEGGRVGVFTMPVAAAAPSSTLAFLKSYVPSLGGSGSDSCSSPTTTSPTTSTTTSSPITPTTTPAAAAAAGGAGGFWSLRKLSMNFLSGNQYSTVSDKSALTGEDEHDTGEEEESRPREEGHRAGYRDDYDDFDDHVDGRRITHENVGTKESSTTPPVSAGGGGGGGLTVSYLASMVSNATQVGAQYIPVQVRDQLPVAVVSSRSLKKD